MDMLEQSWAPVVLWGITAISAAIGALIGGTGEPNDVAASVSGILYGIKLGAVGLLLGLLIVWCASDPSNIFTLFGSIFVMMVLGIIGRTLYSPPDKKDGPT